MDPIAIALGACIIALGLGCVAICLCAIRAQAESTPAAPPSLSLAQGQRVPRRGAALDLQSAAHDSTDENDWYGWSC